MPMMTDRETYAMMSHYELNAMQKKDGVWIRLFETKNGPVQFEVKHKGQCVFVYARDGKDISKHEALKLVQFLGDHPAR